MAVSREEISRWFDEAVEKGATHLVVVVDTYDWEDYPVSVLPGESVHDLVRNPGEMQRVMEVYSMRLDKETQLNEHRAYHLD